MAPNISLMTLKRKEKQLWNQMILLSKPPHSRNNTSIRAQACKFSVLHYSLCYFFQAILASTPWYLLLHCCTFTAFSAAFSVLHCCHTSFQKARVLIEQKKCILSPKQKGSYQKIIQSHSQDKSIYGTKHVRNFTFH